MTGDRLAQLFWRRLPARLLRRFPRLAALLRDGDYLRHVPFAGAVLPLAAFGGGVAAALTETHEVFTYSVVRLAVFACTSALGAGLGACMWLGFALSDLLFVNRARFFWMDGFSYRFHVYASVLVADLLLGWLLVLVPVVSRGSGLGLSRSVRRPLLARFLGGAAHVSVQASLTWVWAQATAFLIRPIWTFQGRSPDTPAIAPLQAHAGVIAMAALLGAIARVLLTAWTERKSPHPAVLQAPVAPLPSPPAAIAIPAKALFVTLMISGLLSGWIEAIAVAAALSAVLTVQTFVYGRWSSVRNMVLRVPLPARLLAAGLMAYVVGVLVVERAARAGASSFASMVVSLVVCLAVSAFLLPAPAPVERRSSP